MNIKEITITLRIPENAYKKLEQYGYDWQKNSEEKARETYFCLRWCEEKEDVTIEQEFIDLET